MGAKKRANDKIEVMAQRTRNSSQTLKQETSVAAWTRVSPAPGAEKGSADPWGL